MMNASNDSKYTCDQESCPIKFTGICLESLPVSECPHAMFVEGFINTDTVVSSQEQLNTDRFLFSGDELTDGELSTITLSHSVNLILILGEVESGKTTMLASLYSCFQKGPLDDYQFAGSRTQIGFEKRCHLARLNSGSKIGHTERTKSTEFSYLHLAVRRANYNEPIQHLLLSDVSGERFKLARDSDEEMKRLTNIRQANKIFYVVDGDQLTDNSKRHSVKQNLIKFLDRLIQNGLLSPSIGLKIIITKWDIITKRGKQETIDTFLLSPVKERFKDFIKEAYSICSWAYDDSDIESGYQLDKFLTDCLEKNLPILPDKGSDALRTTVNREFERYALM